MAKKALKVKQLRKPKYSTRAYTRCRLCGRPHSVLKKYGIFALENLLTKVRYPALKKRVGSYFIY